MYVAGARLAELRRSPPITDGRVGVEVGEGVAVVASCEPPISRVHAYLHPGLSRQNPRQIYYICQALGKRRLASRHAPRL